MHCAGLGNVIKLLSKCTSLEFVCVSLRRAYHIFLYLYLIQIVGVMKSQKANQRNREYILVLLKRFTYTQRPQSIRCVCWMCAFFCSFSLPQLSTAVLYGSNTHTHIRSHSKRVSRYFVVSVHSFVARTTRIIFRYALSHIRLCRQKYRCRCSQTKPPVNVFVRSMPLCECLCFEEFDIY